VSWSRCQKIAGLEDTTGFSCYSTYAGEYTPSVDRALGLAEIRYRSNVFRASVVYPNIFIFCRSDSDTSGESDSNMFNIQSLEELVLEKPSTKASPALSDVTPVNEKNKAIETKDKFKGETVFTCEI